MPAPVGDTEPPNPTTVAPAMTDLLREAVDRLSALPPERQDVVARRILSIDLAVEENNDPDAEGRISQDYINLWSAAEDQRRMLNLGCAISDEVDL